VFFETFPDFVFELDPVPFRDALLNPPDQHRCRVDAFDLGGFVGGEQRDALSVEFFFQFQRAEHIPRRAFDVFTDDGGERRRGGFGLVDQVGDAAVAGDARVGERAPGVAVPALVQVDPAGFHVPVAGGDLPSFGQPFGAGADLPPQGCQRVLQQQGGGAGQDRHRDGLGWPGGGGDGLR